MSACRTEIWAARLEVRLWQGSGETSHTSHRPSLGIPKSRKSGQNWTSLLRTDGDWWDLRWFPVAQLRTTGNHSCLWWKVSSRTPNYLFLTQNLKWSGFRVLFSVFGLFVCFEFFRWGRGWSIIRAGSAKDRGESSEKTQKGGRCWSQQTWAWAVQLLKAGKKGQARRQTATEMRVLHWESATEEEASEWGLCSYICIEFVTSKMNWKEIH